MITRMTRYSMVLPTGDLDAFLASLQELGLMDITRKSRAFDSGSEELFRKISRYRAAVKIISEFQTKDTESKPAGIDIHHEPSAMLDDIETTYSDLVAARKALKDLERKSVAAKPWGEFSRNDIRRINEAGLDVRFFTVPDSKFSEEWENEFPLQVLNRTEGKTYFAVLSPAGEKVTVKATAANLPECTYSEYEERIRETASAIDGYESKLHAYACVRDILAAGMESTRSELDMYFAKDSTVKEGEGCISILEGFAPTEQDSEIRRFLDGSDVLYISEEAKEEDNPPVKLRNNAFARLFEPIGDLYMLPKYGELDLTPYFAPFYMLFFGLCLGDIGYGLVLIAAGMVAKKAAPAFKGYASLVQVLGLGSVIMPLLSGTFFGLSLADEIPSLKDVFLSPIEMFWFAIIFGVFQIVFAKILRAISLMCTKGFIYGLSNLGWAILITTAAFGYAAMEGNSLLPSSVMTAMAATGAGLILLFSKTEGNIFVRIIKGITSFWDITSVFGDVLSYIRLFGLGTSGGILGLVVNSVAGEMMGIPYVGWLFTGLMLLIGHTAVLFLSSLGAFVHPMRLTFIEFYKNSEFEGGGRAFRPFRKGGRQ